MGNSITGGTAFENGENGAGFEEGETLDQELEIDVPAEPDADINDEELEGILNETIEETVRRSQKEAEQQGKEPSAGGQKQLNGAQGQNDKKPINNQTQQAGLDQAPQRFSVAAKEAWKKADPVLKAEYAKAIQDLEHGQQNKLREIAGIRKEAEDIVGVTAPWAKDWAAEGITVPQGIAALLGTHENLIKNAPQEIARLIRDNNTNLEQVQAYLDGKTTVSVGQRSTFDNDITQHPKFIALQNQFESLNNQILGQTVKSETDRIIALRNEVDASGNRPYEYITDPSFLNFAQPRVNALRVPPRDAEGRFVAGGKIPSIFEAYKEIYQIWAHQNGLTQQTQATSTQQSNGVQPQRKPSQPISYRPRRAPSGRVSSPNADPSQFLNETVEQTMKRVLQQQN